jgi:anthranilate/para-aminobenzoate synthase component II
MRQRILLIDNYDSFSFNLVQAFRELGAEVLVHRNDQIGVDQAVELRPTHLIVSPGPGNPSEAGDSVAMIQMFTGRVPILGVCLGHQCIVAAFGGAIVPARELMQAAREDGLPGDLEITARTPDGEIMGVRHRQLMIEGVQFHPESVLTPDGPELMKNFLDRGELTVRGDKVDAVRA